MTHNQIEYAKLKEQVRSNQATEGELQRYHDLSIELGYAQLAETARGNTLNYQVGMANAAAKNAATALEREIYETSGRAYQEAQTSNLNEQAKLNTAKRHTEYHQQNAIDVDKRLKEAQIEKTYAETGKLEAETTKTKIGWAEGALNIVGKVGAIIGPLLA